MRIGNSCCSSQKRHSEYSVREIISTTTQNQHRPWIGNWRPKQWMACSRPTWRRRPPPSNRPPHTSNSRACAERGGSYSYLVVGSSCNILRPEKFFDESLLVRTLPAEEGKPSTEISLPGETRCLIRSEIINALASALPGGTVRYECKVASLEIGSSNSYPTVHLQDGTPIVAKVFIGCDGANSIIAKELGLKPTKVFQLSAVRSLTNYPNGHSFPNEIIRMRKNNISLGRIPITDKLVYWFLTLRVPDTDRHIAQDPELIRKSMLELIKDIFPAEVIEMVKSTDLGSLSLTHMRHRSAWDLLFEKSFRKGTVTVAGDAMHVMGPFLGQGGAAGLEDSVVLARHLAQKLDEINQIVVEPKKKVVIKMIGDAIDGYVKERRMRVVRLSAQSYFTGLLLDESSGLIRKFISILLMLVIFRNIGVPSDYDCGKL